MNLNEHSVQCLRTLDIRGRFIDPNLMVNNGTTLGHQLDRVEEFRSGGIRDKYVPDLNQELSFLFLLGEVYGEPIKEATGMEE